MAWHRQGTERGEWTGTGAHQYLRELVSWGGHNNHSNPTVLNLLSLLLGFPETIRLFQSGGKRLLLDIPFHKDCTQNMEIRQWWWFCHPPCLLGTHRCWRNLFHKMCEVICSHTKVRGYIRQFDSLNHGFVWCAPVLGEVQQLHAAPTAQAVPQSPNKGARISPTHAQRKQIFSLLLLRITTEIEIFQNITILKGTECFPPCTKDPHWPYSALEMEGYKHGVCNT